MKRYEPPFEYQLQRMFSMLGIAEHQCAECRVFRLDGKPPLIHRTNCESSGTAQYYRDLEAGRPATHPTMTEGLPDDNTE